MQQQQQLQVSKERVALKPQDTNQLQTAEQKFAEVQAIARNLFVQHNQDLTQVASRQEQAQDMAMRLTEAKAVLSDAGECKSELDASVEALTEQIRQRLNKVQLSEDACTKLAQRAEQVQKLTQTVAPQLLAKVDKLLSAVVDPTSALMVELRRVKGLLHGKSHAEWRGILGEWRRRIVLLNTWLGSIRDKQEVPTDVLQTVASWSHADHLPIQVMDAPLASALQHPALLPGVDDVCATPQDALVAAADTFQDTAQRLAASSLMVDPSEFLHWQSTAREVEVAIHESHEWTASLQHVASQLEALQCEDMHADAVLRDAARALQSVIEQRDGEGAKLEKAKESLAALEALVATELSLVASLDDEEARLTLELNELGHVLSQLEAHEAVLDQVEAQVARVKEDNVHLEAELHDALSDAEQEDARHASLSNELASALGELSIVTQRVNLLRDNVLALSHLIHSKDFDSPQCNALMEALAEHLGHPVVQNLLSTAAGDDTKFFIPQHVDDAHHLEAVLRELEAAVAHTEANNNAHGAELQRLDKDVLTTRTAMFGTA